MKITHVKTLPHDAAFRDVVFVKVETDEGIHGPGCAIGAPARCSAAVRAPVLK